MTELLTWALEVRDARTTTTDDEVRHSIDALCVPYGVPALKVEHPGGEVFAPSAFSELITSPQTWGKIRLTDSHVNTAERRPVAKATEFRSTDEGLSGTFQFFNTPTGREAWENIAEETYGGVSVGFIALAEGRRGSMREIRSARLHHVALVDEPAYENARVLAMRAAVHSDDPLREFFAQPYRRKLAPRLPKMSALL